MTLRNDTHNTSWEAWEEFHEQHPEIRLIYSKPINPKRKKILIGIELPEGAQLSTVFFSNNVVYVVGYVLNGEKVFYESRDEEYVGKSGSLMDLIRMQFSKQ